MSGLRNQQLILTLGLEAKAFLRDGLYDDNHIVCLSGRFAIPGRPVTLGLSYTFSYTYWRANDSGETAPPDLIRNILSFEVEIFR